MKANRRSLTVQIHNLTEAQVIALEDMFRTWMYLGSVGASRWTAFFADGDGNFQPKITVNGQSPKFAPMVERREVWTGGDSLEGGYKIDFDMIAWRLPPHAD